MQLGGKDSVILQEDNKPKYTAKTVKACLQCARYLVLQNWLGQSPDFSPFDNLWIELKDQPSTW